MRKVYSQPWVDLAAYFIYVYTHRVLLPVLSAVLQDQLRMLHVEMHAIGPHDPTAAAQLTDSEAAIMTRIAEKKLQMMVTQ